MAENTTATIEQPAAPAEPSAPAKSERPDFSAFDRAETQKDLARVSGKPAPAPAASPEPPAAAPPAVENEDAPALDAQGQPVKDAAGRQLSRREQKQEQRTREAVDRATAALQKEIADLKARIQPPAADPAARTEAPPADAKPAAAAVDKEPTLEDFINEPDPYLAFNRALARWEVRQELKQEREAAAQKEQATAHDRRRIEKFTTYQQREDALKASVPDFDAKTLEIRKNLNFDSPLALAVIESEFAPQLILHLAEHPDEFNRIGQLGMSNLPAALREIGRLEARFVPAASAATATTGSPAAAAEEPKAPKLISSAPPIGTTLGTQPAPAADATRAAVASKDFRAFDEAETAKDLARRRR